MYDSPVVPRGSEVVVITSGATPGVTTIDSAFVVVAAAVSVTRTVNDAVLLAVGEPLMTPVVDSVTPAGSAPDARLHVRAPVPPVAANVALYAVPTVPPGNVAVVIARGGVVDTVTVAVANAGVAASAESTVAVLTIVVPFAAPESTMTGTMIDGRFVPAGIDPAAVYAQEKEDDDEAVHDHDVPVGVPESVRPDGKSSLTRNVSGSVSAVVPAIRGVSV